MKHYDCAKTPPMGWNSWDCYGASVTEAEIRQNAVWMAENLKKHGWDYVIVDIQWYEPTADGSKYHTYVPLEMDEWSRLIPAANRFPSSAKGAGFKPLADFVHGLGLKFGIHIMRGIPRQAAHAATAILGTNANARTIAHPNSICPWNTDMYGVNVNVPGAQEYYNSIFALYASWDVDFVKVDDISASKLYDPHQGEIKLIRKAIDASGRNMVLSLSPGPAVVDLADTYTANANMWRITDDFWDRWDLLLDMFDRCEAWYSHVGPGHWPDCDMLPLGHLGIRSTDGGGTDRQTRFTRDEQLTMMTLWTIFRSPLMMGGELIDADDWTLSLLMNAEVLDMHRNSSGCRLVSRKDDRVVWTADGKDGIRYVAVFNIGEKAHAGELSLSALGIAAAGKVSDLWKGEGLTLASGKISLDVPPHGARLLKFSR